MNINNITAAYLIQFLRHETLYFNFTLTTATAVEISWYLIFP